MVLDCRRAATGNTAAPRARRRGHRQPNCRSPAPAESRSTCGGRRSTGSQSDPARRGSADARSHVARPARQTPACARPPRRPRALVERLLGRAAGVRVQELTSRATTCSGSTGPPSTRRLCTTTTSRGPRRARAGRPPGVGFEAVAKYVHDATARERDGADGERARAAPSVSRLAVADRRLTEVLHERVHHPHRRAPRAVRGADGLHHVFEDRRPLEHPARASRGPREVVVVHSLRVEVRQVVVEPEHVVDASRDVLLHADARRRPDDLDQRVPRTPLADAHTPGSAAPGTQRDFERPRFLVESGRRELREPVGVHRPPQVDRLSAGAGERQLQLGRHVVGAWRRRNARTLFLLPHVCIEHHLAEWFLDRS